MSSVQSSIARGPCPICGREIDRIEHHNESQFVPRDQSIKFYRHKDDKSFCMKDGS